MFHVDEGVVRNRDAWQLWGRVYQQPGLHIQDLLPAKVRIKVHGGGGGERVLVICVLRNYKYFTVGRSWPKQELH